MIQIVRDSSGRPDLRQLSARALGQLVSEGLLAEAKALLSPEYRSDGLALLLAAEMTTNHSGAETEDFLKRLAQQGGTTVQAIALRHLQRLSPQSVVDLATGAGQEQFHVNHPHNGVRQTICESCYLVGSLETVDILLTYLDDAHPGNRQLAADALYRLAQQDSLRAAVIGGVTDSLRHPSWRTLEEACELSAFLDLSKSQEQVVVLLNHEIPEVAAAAAFAIKEFDLDSTTGPALARLNENLRQQFALNVDEQIHRYRFTSRQTQHLCEHLGRRQVRDADPILRGFIPKRVENGEVVREPWCRSTAIWALGRIHDGELDAGLASLLRARLNDVDSLVPESDQVREASAYALGWFGDRESLESFQRFLSRKSPTRGVGHACAWAKEKLTGETVPVLPVLEQTLSSDWFLRPVKPMPSESAN
ncbi:MAG: hypothetical protein KDA80_21540 [Planctomycetaceae bacterium]|nr:hypothetical protein [Planctomycetaceae bacterium]